MNKKTFILLALLCAIAQGTWAQTWTEVSTKEQLNAAIQDGASIRLTADITLSAHLKIGESTNQTVTLDLNGHTLKRNLSSASSDGHVIEVYSAGTLTVTDGATGGTITGGWANNGGGICNYGKLYFQGGTITECKTAYASGCMGGGIKNNRDGTVTMTGGTITHCESGDCGGIYNGEGATLIVTGGTISDCKSGAGGGGIVNYGTATLSNLTLTGNTAGTRGGNIWNNGSLTINECVINGGQSIIEAGGLYLNGGTATLTSVEIRDNTSRDAGAIFVTPGATLDLKGNSTLTGNKSTEHGGGGIVNYGTTSLSDIILIARNTCFTNGGGIWSNGTLNMQGDIVVEENTTTDGMPQNVYLKSGKVINVTGSFDGMPHIGVTMESSTGTFTSGYHNYHDGNAPSIYFFSDVAALGLVKSDGEAALTAPAGNAVIYIDRQWDATNKKVTHEAKTCTNYTEISGDNSGDILKLEADKWYVVKGSNVKRKRIVVPDDATVHLILCDGASLSSFVNFRCYQVTSEGNLHIYGQGNDSGKLIADASGDREDAGIGGTTEEWDADEDENEGDRTDDWDYKSLGNVYIHGGTIEAKGGSEAPGIGNAEDIGTNRGTLVVYGGNVTATGGEEGAGIGGGGNGAAISAVTVYGGKVHAKGGSDAAGIGSGEEEEYDNIDGGSLTVWGGSVYAEGTGWGAGIGGGEDADGINVTIHGGKVTAKAGDDAGSKNGSAIGSEEGDGHFGSLTLDPNVMVHAGSDADNLTRFTEPERLAACRWRPYAVIEPCTHEGASFVISGPTGADTHSMKCRYCKGYDNAPHTFDDYGTCTVCGVNTSYYTVSVYLPADNEDTGSYAAAPVVQNVVVNATITLPAPPKEFMPGYLVFAGWRVGTPTSAGEHYYAQVDEDGLLAAGASYKVEGNTSLTARYKLNNITIADAADNTNVLTKNHGQTVNKVTLTGRTLYKDGKWNTICLPFDLEIANTHLDGDGVDVRTLGSSSWSDTDKTLVLNFTEKGAVTKLEAGKPYLIKWNNTGKHIVDPIFAGVTINYNPQAIDTKYMSFVGTFSHVGIYMMNFPWPDKLYLGSDNKLYLPTQDGFKVNAFRGYFLTKGGVYATENGIYNAKDGLTPPVQAREVILNFGDEETGITERNYNNICPSEAWYDLQGRKIADGKSTNGQLPKGLYIYKGKKTIIK